MSQSLCLLALSSSGDLGPLYPHLLWSATAGPLQDWAEMPGLKEPQRAFLSLLSLLACKNRTCRLLFCSDDSCFLSSVMCHLIDVSVRWMTYDSEPAHKSTVELKDSYTPNHSWSWWQQATGAATAWAYSACSCAQNGWRRPPFVCSSHTTCSECTTKALTPMWLQGSPSQVLQRKGSYGGWHFCAYYCPLKITGGRQWWRWQS